MSRNSIESNLDVFGFPRSRGDEPFYTANPWDGLEFSPLTRG